MKMKKDTYRLLLRFIAGLAASLILVGATALISQSSSKNLYKHASGVNPDSVVMTIGGQDVSAQEYLYWLSYYCDYYNQYLQYMGITDWNTELSEGFTAGDYIAQQGELQALSMVSQYAVIDSWANEAGITLTDADLANIAAQRESSIEQLGSEQAYRQSLQAVGIDDDFVVESLSHSFLISHLYEAYCTEGSSIYPGAASITEYADAHDYLGALILFTDTCEMGKAEKEVALTQMKGYATSLRQAEDADSAFAVIAEKLGLNPTVTTFAADQMEASFVATLKSLPMDSVSNVITTDEGYYVAIRREPDTEIILNDMLNDTFAERCQNADVSCNDKVYGSIHTLTFYQKLLAARSPSVN